jgi:hypothetical protein
MVVGEPCDRKLASSPSVIELGLMVHLKWSLRMSGGVALIDMRLSGHETDQLAGHNNVELTKYKSN